MCEHGDSVGVEVLVCSEVAHSGRNERRVKPIDRCIAPIVKALDAGGIAMLGSCCGHGKAPGSILLRDGRELTLVRDNDMFYEGDTHYRRLLDCRVVSTGGHGMSIDVNTDLGTLRIVNDEGVDGWLLWCSVCNDWEKLSGEQFEGRLSVNHAASGCPSRYHETHNFAREVAVKIAAFKLMDCRGENPVVRHASERPLPEDAE